MKSTSPHLKLNIYTRPAGDRQSSQRAQYVGSCMVDLRYAEVTLADPQSARYQWYKMRGHNPGQLKLRVQMRGMPRAPPEPTASAQEDLEQEEENENVETGRRRSRNEYAPHSLREDAANEQTAISMLPEDDAVVIGDREKATKYFTLTIELNGVYGLHTILNDRKGPLNLWFSYKIFGVLIQTDTFVYPKASTFPYVEDSFVIRSNDKDLTQWLELQPPVRIMLCTEGQALALVEIPLNQLVRKKRLSSEYELSQAELVGGFDIQPLRPLAAAARYEVAADEFNAVLNGKVSLTDQDRQPSPPEPITSTREKEEAKRIVSGDQISKAEHVPHSLRQEAPTEQTTVLPAYEYREPPPAQVVWTNNMCVDITSLKFTHSLLTTQSQEQAIRDCWLELGIGRFVCLCNEALNLPSAKDIDGKKELKTQIQSIFPSSSLDDESGDILTIRLLCTNDTERFGAEIPDDCALCIGFANSQDLYNENECVVPLYDVNDLKRYQMATQSEEEHEISMNPIAWVTLEPGKPSESPSRSSSSRASTQEEEHNSSIIVKNETKRRLVTRQNLQTEKKTGQEHSEDRDAKVLSAMEKSEIANSKELSHFRLSFELRSVKGLQQSSNVYATTRFDQYRFAHAAIHQREDSSTEALSKLKLRTRPTVQISPHSEENLPNSFRLFEFVSSGENLTEELKKSLSVHLWHRDKKRYEHDQKVGTAQCVPGEVILANRLYRCPFTHKTFQSKAAYNRHLTHLKANQDTSRPFFPESETRKKRQGRKQGSDDENEEENDEQSLWDVPPTILRILDLYLPVANFAKKQYFNGPPNTEGLQAPRGIAPGGEAEDRLEVTAYARVLVMLEDFGSVNKGMPSSGTAASAPSSAFHQASDFYGIHSIPEDAKYVVDPEEGRSAELIGASAGSVGTSMPYPPGLSEYLSRQEAFKSGGHQTSTQSHWSASYDRSTSYNAQEMHKSGNHQTANQHHWSATYNRATSFDDLPPAIRADALRAFERWREEAEESWIAELKEKERKKLNELEKEYQEREENRQAEMKALSGEYASLESQLKKAIAKAERRALTLESKLTSADEQMKSKLDSIKEKEKRVDEEVQMKVASERAKSDALKERIKSLEAEVDRERKRSEQIQDEFTKYRTAQSETPEAALRDKISKVEGENLSLQKELNNKKEELAKEQQQSSKLRAQVFVLAREVSKYRAKERDAAEQELARLRVEYLAREERYVLDDDRATLRKIRQQLHQLQDAEAECGDNCTYKDGDNLRADQCRATDYESKVSESLYAAESKMT